MSRVPPETTHRRLQNQKGFLTDQDRDLFEDLKNRIRSLLGDEKYPLPEANEPGAWVRTYPHYLRALQKQRDQQEPASNSLIEGEWNAFLACRVTLKEYLERAPFSRVSEILKYVGLEKNDLDEPIIADERMGSYRVRDWQSRYSRVSSALSRLTNMTPSERHSVPERMALRRAVAAIDSINEKLGWHDVRISALEGMAINPNNKH
jgi:hypothetical protein